MELLVPLQNGVLVNRTRAADALSDLLNNSRRTIIQVEVLVAAAAVLQFLQLVFGTWKRRWHNSIVILCLWVCNASLLPLVFYTLSIMQSSPVKNSMYPVWGATLLMAAGGTIAVSPFDYDEKEHKARMQTTTGIARYLFYFFMLSLLLSPVSGKEYLQLHPQAHTMSASSSCVYCLLVILYLTKITESTSLSIRARQSMDQNANDHDPETMKCANNPVGYVNRWLYRPKVITIDQIWGSCGDSYHGETLEEARLSLGLCQSLIPRLRGLSIAKASLPTTTHDSIFSGLLQTERRAFRVIEVELGFCYDFFFTKYDYIYFGTVLYFPLFLLRVILITLALHYTVQGSLTIETPDPIIQVQITRVDNIITEVLLVLALVVELLQALVYIVASDWIKVSLASVYVKYKQIAFLEKLISFLSRVTTTSRQRRNRVAQHTVMLPDKFFCKFFPKCNLDPVEISHDTEKAIAGSIKPTFGEQTNQLASQVRNSMFQHLTLKDHWTLKDHSQVEIMLIWHIATDYCHHLSESSGDESNPDQNVAVTLSRYCAYLLAFVPQLLPYHEAGIRKSIRTVKEERDKDLHTYGCSERYQEMKGIRR